MNKGYWDAVENLKRMDLQAEVKKKLDNESASRYSKPTKPHSMHLEYCSARHVFGEGHHTIDCDGHCDFQPDVQEFVLGTSLELNYESEIL